MPPPPPPINMALGAAQVPPGQGLLLHGPQVMLTCAARAEPGAIWAEATSNDNGYCGSHIRRFSVAMEHHPGASCNKSKASAFTVPPNAFVSPPKISLCPSS